MKFSVLFGSLIVLVHGKAQYNYPRPTGSFSSPSVGHISGINNENFSNNGDGYTEGTFNNQYQSHNGEYINDGYNEYNTGPSGNGYEEYNFTPNNNGFREYNPRFSGNGYEWNDGGSSNTGYGEYYGESSGNGYTSSGTAPELKHIYIQIPPSETEIYSQRRPVILTPPEKHYRIVLIKAPTAATPTALALPPQPQIEEKTLVYVLVQKSDDTPEIILPTVAPTAPSKPEVYFIRYKNKKESEDNGSSSASENYGEGNLSMGNGNSVETENNEVAHSYGTSIH